MRYDLREILRRYPHAFRVLASSFRHERTPSGIDGIESLMRAARCANDADLAGLCLAVRCGMIEADCLMRAAIDQYLRVFLGHGKWRRFVLEALPWYGSEGYYDDVERALSAHAVRAAMRPAFH